MKSRSSNIGEKEMPTPKLWRRAGASTLPFLPLTAICSQTGKLAQLCRNFKGRSVCQMSARAEQSQSIRGHWSCCVLGTIVLPWQCGALVFLCSPESLAGHCTKQSKCCAPLVQLCSTAAMTQGHSKAELHLKHFGGLTDTYFWNDCGEKPSWSGAGIAE